MLNTSATGGYLLAEAPAEQLTLDQFLNTMIRGIAGLDGSLVRPRWQPNPAPMPDHGKPWIAFGVMNSISDADAYLEQQGDTSEITQHEAFEVDISVYGTGAQERASRLRHGLAVAQNREALFHAGISLVGADIGIRHVPELVNELWLDRADMTVSMRREIRLDYPVLYFVSLSGEIRTDQHTPPLTVPFSAAET